MQRSSGTRAAWAILGLVALGGGPAPAQPDPFGQPAARDPFAPPAQPAASAPAGTPPVEGESQIVTPALVESLVPPLRSGARAEILRREQQIIPTVVIVPDLDSYVRALEAWTPLRRFPVLIDDGTRAAREDIARFVRGFAPDQVVRWRVDDPRPLESAGDVQTEAESSLRRVWNFGSEQVPTLDDAGRGVCGVASPGIVVTSASDPAWAGGLALAIGRGQTMIWVEARQDINGELTKAEGEALCAAVESALTSMGAPWQEMGDHIDLVALCLNTPARMGTDTPGERVAVTDRLGHFSDAQTDVRRWGWTSQIHGSAAQSAYRAMCGLFVTPDSAWLFDTYPGGQPWDTYALRFAANAFDASGMFRTTLTERSEIPGVNANGLGAWRRAIGLPLDQRLVMVNTKGMADHFEFSDGGIGWCGDVPILDVPAAVYFVHSWSSFRPGDRTTLAGRWFERGAFAYVGAVQEPYLQSFVPGAAIAARFLSGASWAVTCRGDRAPAWRLAIFGDPMWAAAPAQSRCPDPLPLEGAVALTDSMRQAIRERRMVDAVTDLSLLGRDDQAARLVGAMLEREAGVVTPELAHVALPSVFRAGQETLDTLGVFYSLYRLLPEQLASDAANRDLLWMTARRALPTDGSILATLRPHVRPEQRTSDMVELAMHAATSGQRDPAIALLTEYRQTLVEVDDTALVDVALTALRAW